MGAGKYKHRVSIEIAHVARGTSGGEDKKYAIFANVWAEIVPLSGREAIIAQAEAAISDTRITMRWSPNIDLMHTDFRIRHRKVIYRIDSARNIKMEDREVVVLCSSVGEEGA